MVGWGGQLLNCYMIQHTDSFREACEALLDQVLIAANILDKDQSATAKCAAVTPASIAADSATPSQRQKERQRHVKLIDVGIGCGDQTLYLTRKLSRPASTPAKETGVQPGKRHETPTESRRI